MSFGIEEIWFRAADNPSTIIWLILTGGFMNNPALHLYLARGFQIIGWLGTAVMMAICYVDNDSVTRSIEQMMTKLEGKFLLPILKSQALTSAAGSTSEKTGGCAAELSSRESQASTGKRGYTDDSA